MTFLLDTHVVLWWLDDPALLSSAAQAAIKDRTNDVLVSAAVAWEIGIKQALGKLTAPADFETAIQVSGFQSLPITVAHALAAGRLPGHHRDPFDRMLVAQTLQQAGTLVTRDPHLAAYGIPIIPA